MDEIQEEDKINVPIEVILQIFEKTYPVQFAHCMSLVELEYWKSQAQAKPKAKAPVKKTARTGGKRAK